MPDILIRGMEMPKNCGACYLNHGEFCFMLCRKLNLPQEWEARPKNCPLVELPPHGDLIDRSEVLFDAGDVCEGCGDYAVFGYSCDQINSYKVIVPASEED